MTTQEIIERIKQMAIQLADAPLKSKMTESEVLITLILPRIIQVIFQAEADSLDYLGFTKEHIVTFSSGVADLPTSVLASYTKFIRFIEVPNTSWVRNWASFKNCLEGAADDTCPKDVSRFTIRINKLYYMERGQVWNAFDGDLTIEAVTLPAIGANPTDVFDVPEDFLQKMLAFAAGIVSEKIPLEEIGINIRQEEDDNE